jgi:hypothetical protein
MNSRQNLRDKLLSADGLDPAGASAEEVARFRQLLDRAQPASSMWRRIMRNPTARFTTVAAVFVAVIAIVTWDRSAGRAWSMEQTIAAIKQLETLQIRGTVIWGPDSDPQPMDFAVWVRSPGKDSEPLKMRFECDKRIFIVRGDTAYECWPQTKVAKIKQGAGIRELKFWYRAAERSPWLTGKILETLRLFSDDWTQTVRHDPNTAEQQILITCSYGPSGNSYLLVVDPQSKLIQSAKMWDNLQREGDPVIDARVFVYNAEAPDALFEVPSDMTLANRVDDEQSRALFRRGEDLFHKEKKYAEAIEVYQQVYDKYREMNVAEEALMMIGLCHHRLAQYDQEIEAYEKAVREYAHLKGWIEATYFYLGSVYMRQGRNDEALEAFESCLKAGEEVRKPDQFPLKEARAYIAKIKGQ